MFDTNIRPSWSALYPQCVEETSDACEGLKPTNPRSVRENQCTCWERCQCMEGCGWPTWWCWRWWLRKVPAATVLQQHTVHRGHFLPAQRCAQVHLRRYSLGQRKLIDLCIVSADLFHSVLDVRVKRGAELSTGRYLLACSFRLEKLTGFNCTTFRSFSRE